MKQPNKWMAFFLAAALFVGGCAAESVKSVPEASAPAVPMGRYVETDITPPEAAQAHRIRSQALRVRSDGTVDYLVYQRDQREGEGRIAHYQSPDGGDTWTQLDTGWVQKVWRACGGEWHDDWLPALEVDENGAIYCGLNVDEEKRLFRIEPDGETTELTPPEWQDDAYWGMESIRVTENGSIGMRLYGLTDGAALYDPAGKALAQTPVSSMDRLAFGGGVIYHGESVLEMAGARQEEIPLPHSGEEMALEFCPDGALLVATHAGVDCLEQGAAVFQTLLDGDRYSFSEPYSNVDMLRCGADDSFYMVLSEGMGERLYRYAYDPKVPMKPDTQLDVFSMRESALVKSALLDFQRQNPSVTVKYQVGLSEESPLDAGEVTAALENALACGKGPDVLILDGLDWQSYAQNGWLAPLALPLPGTFESMRRACRAGDALYAVPARFELALEVRIGDSEPFWQRIGGPEALNYTLTAAEEAAGDAFDLKKLQGRFVPKVLAGVNAAGDKQELSAAFVELLLTGEPQRQAGPDGFPTEKEAFVQLLEQDYEQRFTGRVEDLLALCENSELMIES